MLDFPLLALFILPVCAKDVPIKTPSRPRSGVAHLCAIWPMRAAVLSGILGWWMC